MFLKIFAIVALCVSAVYGQQANSGSCRLWCETIWTSGNGPLICATSTAPTQYQAIGEAGPVCFNLANAVESGNDTPDADLTFTSCNTSSPTSSVFWEIYVAPGSPVVNCTTLGTNQHVDLDCNNMSLYDSGYHTCNTSTTQHPFNIENTTFDLTAQAISYDPSHQDGFVLSTACHLYR